MRGRKPVSPTLKLLKGTQRKRGKRQSLSPQPLQEPPKMLTDEAKTEWRRIAPVLARWGILTPADEIVLTLYCQCVSDVHRLKKLLEDAGGPIYKTKTLWKVHPAYTLLHETSLRLLKLAGELALTPASRLRILGSASPPPEWTERDELDRFLNASTRKNG